MLSELLLLLLLDTDLERDKDDRDNDLEYCRLLPLDRDLLTGDLDLETDRLRRERGDLDRLMDREYERPRPRLDDLLRVIL